MTKFAYTFKLALIALTLICAQNLMAANNNNKNHKNKKPVDNKAVAFLEVVNEYEIDAAKAVVNRVKNTDVKKFAERMIKDHSANLDATKKLSKERNITPDKTKKITRLEKNNKINVATLNGLNGPALDKKYIELMESGHKAALAKIDSYLKKDVKDSALKTHLQNTRTTVADHLEMAKKIEKDLNKPVILKKK